VQPRPSAPGGKELEIESIETVPGGADARVSGRGVEATVHLKGGAIYLVDGVDGLPGLR
jgi:hypothetical protein